MFSFLNHLPQVTKNILLLNIMMFIVSLVLESKGIHITSQLGAHYVNSPLFEPFQIITHFFMHGNFMHLFFNMWLFVMLGAFLEQLWGPKRFFIFYIASALGAFALYNVLGVSEIHSLNKQLTALGYDMQAINEHIRTNTSFMYNPQDEWLVNDYMMKVGVPMVGASGAIFGIMAAFAILFPNTEFRLYFAIPIKAKYLVGGYVLLELYLAFQNNLDDPVAHLAHVGGALVGAIIVFFWRKRDRSNFY